jgi:hypothetical protein
MIETGGFAIVYKAVWNDINVALKSYITSFEEDM